MKTLFFTLLLAMMTMTGYAQKGAPTVQFLTYNNYDNYVSQRGVVVVEFWARWNNENSYDLQALQRAQVYRVNIDTESELVYEFEIEVIPTVFIYKDGELRHVDESDVSFKRKDNLNHIQEHIDYLYYE